jgi:glyoxylase-like metal-dependent hydrolase (beta-lactamase superfamily II)
MQRFILSLVVSMAAAALAGLPASAQVPELTLTRLEGGTPVAPLDVNARFSDTYAFPGVKLQFVYSCYIIKHGDDYMLWDTGQAMTAGPVAPKVSATDLLAQLKISPDQVKFVGISHFHGDHIGQANQFPKATLLIGKGDWDGLTSAKPPMGVNPALVSNWVTGGGNVEPVVGDKDVFGDGSVVMLNTPGHTPGHHSLLVRLAQMGPVILIGDLAHFHENYDKAGVPAFNFDRSQTIASIDRVKQLAANLKATVIIQHDARDVSKLPSFPASAK